jgi:hypothetical protein
MLATISPCIASPSSVNRPPQITPIQAWAVPFALGLLFHFAEALQS